MSDEHLLQTLVLGYRAVGKTSLITRFAEGTFSDHNTSTIGVDFVLTIQKQVKARVESQDLKLRLWDQGGSSRFRYPSQFLQQYHGILEVYSVTDENSFLEAQREVTGLRRDAPHAVIVIIGNKSDLVHQRKVSYCQGAQLAESLNVLFLETSAKAGANVEQAFWLVSILEAISQGFSGLTGIHRST